MTAPPSQPYAGKNAADAGLDFEEGLRQILSPESTPVNHGGAPAPRASSIAMQRLLEAAEKAEAERKALFWLRLLRPIAIVAFIGLLAGFVYRITTFGAAN